MKPTYLRVLYIKLTVWAAENAGTHSAGSDRRTEQSTITDEWRMEDSVAWTTMVSAAEVHICEICYDDPRRLFNKYVRIGKGCKDYVYAVLTLHS